MSKGIFAFFSTVAFTSAIISASFWGVNADRVRATGYTAESKVVVVVADYLSIEDINSMDFLSSLAAKSHIALLNNRQLGKAGASKSKLIIGSGKRLELNANMCMGGSEESFRKLYSIESGRALEPESLIYTDIYKLKNRNDESEYQNFIGYLGDAVNKNNGIACFLGNADAAEQNRSSMLIAMDSSGEVDIGTTEGILIEDELFPHGRRTDYNKLADLYKQYLAASSFVVIETGDMERLETFRSSMSVKSYENFRRGVLKKIDSFIKELFSYGGFKTLVVISTYPSRTDIEVGNRLTPVLAYDASGGGLLYSSSTRRQGIILNTDLADYLLCKLGYSDSSAIVELRSERAGYYLEAMNRNIVRTSILRVPVLTTYAVMVIAAIGILFITAVFFRKGSRTVNSGLGSYLTYTMLIFPMVLLYLPTAALGGSPVGYIAYVTAASLALSSILHIAFKEKLKAILAICIMLFIGLSADILTDSPFIKQSVLGYDPIIGARFYGIGNEYAGIFIGSSLMAFGCLRELYGNKLNKGIALLVFTACTSLLGLTFLGANFGGAIAGASGYLLAYYLVYGIEFNKRNASIGILILGGAAALLVAADSLGIGSPSHIRGLIKETETNGIEIITSTIQRKISMNLTLIRYTIWTKVLLCIIAAISIMFFKPVKLLGSVFDRYRYLEYSWISIAASAIVGFAVNDSGIVLAATAMIYAAFTMLILCIGERNES
ncbi:MAG: hypothetical protein ACYCYE_12520 [Clostridia bacterium]